MRELPGVAARPAAAHIPDDHGACRGVCSTAARANGSRARQRACCGCRRSIPDARRGTRGARGGFRVTVLAAVLVLDVICLVALGIIALVESRG